MPLVLVSRWLHTTAPSSMRVSIRTAVWTVMCKQPAMRAPASGLDGPYFLRMAISPGISFSARIISLRPKSAKEMSAKKNWHQLILNSSNRQYKTITCQLYMLVCSLWDWFGTDSRLFRLWTTRSWVERDRQRGLHRFIYTLRPSGGQLRQRIMIRPLKEKYFRKSDSFLTKLW